MLEARPLFTIDKPRKVTPVERNGRVFLHITKTRFIGSGETLEGALLDANLRTFTTGYRVVTKGERR